MRGPSGQGRKSIDADTREKLLTAVGDLMTDRRSTEVSLSEIALKSGVNSSLVKYYFGNKAGLMVELLRRVLGPKVEQMAHLAEMNLSAPQKLRIHISGIVNTYYNYPYASRLMHSLLAEGPEFATLIAKEFSKPIGDLQRAILKQGVTEGVFRDVNPAFLYTQIIGSCDQFFFGSYQLEGVFGISQIDDRLRREFAGYFYESIMHGIAAASG